MLEGGRVKETGSHPELVDKGGLYSELWSGKYTNQVYFLDVFTDTVSAQEVMFGDSPKENGL